MITLYSGKVMRKIEVEKAMDQSNALYFKFYRTSALPGFSLRIKIEDQKIRSPFDKLQEMITFWMKSTKVNDNTSRKKLWIPFGVI